MTSLKTESLRACAAALRAHGFLKKSGVFLRPGSNPAVTGWLGLNLATWDLPARLQVNPVVGVRHVPLENPLAELAGWPPPVANVSMPLGYLMPGKTFQMWDFPAGGDLAAIAEDLAGSVSRYGGPFVEQWSDWNVFSDQVGASGLLTDNERFFVLPVILLINGDRRGALQLVQQELDRVGDSPDVYSQAYREFASGLAGWTFSTH